MSSLQMTREEFEKRKEISRFPACPPLDPVMIEIVTATVLVEPDPQRSDVLFVFGSSRDDQWNQVAGAFKSGLAPRVFIAGGVGGKSFETGRILSHIIRDDFVRLGVPFDKIIVDERSTNTLEDAQNGKEIFEANGIPHGRILFACKWPHSGRCLRTLRKVFPDSKLFPFPYDFKYDGILYTGELRSNWWKSEATRSFIWGEYERIRLYSGRGDICP